MNASPTLGSGTPSSRSRPTARRSSLSASSRPCALSALRAACRAAQALAAWLLHLRGHAAPVRDAGADSSLAEGPLPEAARRVLAFLDPPLADDAEMAADVTAHARALLRLCEGQAR